MGLYIIKMPDIGEGIAEVELVAWGIKPGDIVTEDQILAEVMTDKATVEIPSPVNGKVLRLGGELGETMAVGSELVCLEVEGAGNVQENAQEIKGEPITTKAEDKTTSAKLQESTNAHNTSTKQSNDANAVCPKTISQTIASLAQNETNNKETPPTTSTIRAEATQPRTRAFGEKPLASPAVRHRAWDLGIELQFVQGSGSNGRITHEDLEAYQRQQSHAPSQNSAVSPSYAPRTETQEVPVIGLRRKIAEKMQRSKRNIPHFTYVEEIDVTDLEALRLLLNAQYASERGKLTFLPFIARAMVLALNKFPQINATFDEEAGIITRYAGVHLGIATQTDNGLLVTVLRHAESRDLWANAREISRLAKAARDGQAAREELSGSTITLTSLGALGGIVSTPVINHPEVGIVGVNRLIEKPVVLNGQIVIRKTMNLSSSFDHRIVDGMQAAQFIQMIKTLLEAPATLFIE